MCQKRDELRIRILFCERENPIYKLAKIKERELDQVAN